MTALTPIVFHSAFVDHDPVALDILQSASGAVASLIARNLAPLSSSHKSNGGSSLGGRGEPLDPPMPVAASSVLCLGGSLVGVPAYRDLVLGHLKRMGHVFPHVEFVKDAAEAGALRLVSMYAREMEMETANGSSATKAANGSHMSHEAIVVHA